MLMYLVHRELNPGLESIFLDRYFRVENLGYRCKLQIVDDRLQLQNYGLDLTHCPGRSQNARLYQIAPVPLKAFCQALQL